MGRPSIRDAATHRLPPHYDTIAAMLGHCRAVAAPPYSAATRCARA